MKTRNGALLPVILAFAAAALIFLPIPLGAQDNHFRIVGMAFFHGALATSWNVFALTGGVSLGHAAFFGLGAYGSALSCQYLHLSPYPAMLVGGGFGAAYGMLWAVAFSRLRGAGLALATLASVQIPRVIIDNWDTFTAGSMGIVGIPGLPSLRLGSLEIAFGRDIVAQYYLLLFFALGITFVHTRAIHSRWGWALRAVREDETAAGALGIDVWTTRFKALTVSAFLTGICGGLYAHLMGLIEPGLVFSLHISALPLVLSIFGGRYQTFGPLLGAMLLYPVDQFILHAWLPVGHAALYGLVVILTLLFFPHGIGAWLQQRTRSL